MWMIFHKPSPVGMLTLSSDAQPSQGCGWMGRNTLVSDFQIL